MKTALKILQWIEGTRCSLGQWTFFYRRTIHQSARWMLQVEVKWEPRDLWRGLFWKTFPAAAEFYVCPVPCVVVRIYVLSFQ